MRNLFNTTYRKPIKRNKFNLSFINDFTTDYGNLTPCAIYDVNAGEIFRISTESFVRTQPLRAPAYTNSDVSYHWFFVPYRLIFDDWTDFIVRGRNGDTDYVKPFARLNYITSNGSVDKFVVPNSLMDFLNFPTFNNISTLAQDLAAADMDTKYDMLPFNAYNLIFNEYYRDENLQPEVFIWSQQGDTDNINEFTNYASEVGSEYGINMALFVLPFHLRRRSWRKDYFTSALPFVQKGSPISLVGSVDPVSGNSFVPVQFMPTTWNLGDPTSFFLGVRSSDGTGSPASWMPGLLSRTSSQNIEAEQTGLIDHHHLPPSYSSAIYSNVNAFISLPELQTNVMSISDLRVALALQQWFELNARTGSDRYFEYLLGHFGVRDRDSRMQRPEYVCGFSHAIQISEVEQTSGSEFQVDIPDNPTLNYKSTTPQGNLAGRGLGYAHNRPAIYRCPEPGFLMCIQSIRPRAVYYQGFPRMYQRWDAFDYFDPLFDHLSEQNIKTSELFWNPAIQPWSDNDRDFGYTPRFSELRTKLNELHGDFRASLSYWISPRDFSASNTLNSNLVEINPYTQGLNEMFAFPGDTQSPAPHFLCHVIQHVDAIRPMSKYATPGL